MTKTTKNLTITIFGLIAGMMLCSCSHSSFGRLVGSDRDEHGCIGSAGYTWSYALHDCIRLWEAGIRFDAGPEQTFVVFSSDSTYAEVFSGNHPSLLFKRKKNKKQWTSNKNKGNEGWVKIQNGILCVNIHDYTYTKRIK